MRLFCLLWAHILSGAIALVVGLILLASNPDLLCCRFESTLGGMEWSTENGHILYSYIGSTSLFAGTPFSLCSRSVLRYVEFIALAATMISMWPLRCWRLPFVAWGGWVLLAFIFLGLAQLNWSGFSTVGSIVEVSIWEKPLYSDPAQGSNPPTMTWSGSVRRYRLPGAFLAIGGVSVIGLCLILCSQKSRYYSGQ